MAATPPKHSDLGVRTASAVVMIAVVGSALWLGGWWWTAFVAAVALGVLWEWCGLVTRFEETVLKRALWLLVGLLYVGLGASLLASLREDGIVYVAVIALAVIATDVGAYFAGRTFGGPKIAPRISPSKTWSGFVGGAFGAVIVCWSTHFLDWDLSAAFNGDQRVIALLAPFIAGSLVAIIAQAGDFFESWMKRKAGVKDSGNLIPGHGGLFDRVDGLLAVCFVFGAYGLSLAMSHSGIDRVENLQEAVIRHQ